MDRVEPDQTPAEAWKSSLDATCNRLMSHYHGLLRAAAAPPSAPDQDGAGGGGSAHRHGVGQVGSDPRAGGGCMRDADDPPPPPLAANVEMTALQAKLAAENLCVASSNALDLIRTLRLSVLLADEELMRAEEEEEALEMFEASLIAEDECASLEARLMELRRRTEESAR
ncbi:hypothetical protein ACHAW5_006943 [Stephanodiscus triporus]|uniref:Mediator of RNA polymerase II transcription subunit 21 n=1 Tax=Stephanodiscus triporus TaxID=2934178 RepID=A0ABD3NTR7_9STRA